MEVVGGSKQSEIGGTYPVPQGADLLLAGHQTVRPLGVVAEPWPSRGGLQPFLKAAAVATRAGG